MKHLFFIVMLSVVTAASLYAEETQEERNWLISLSSDLLTYRVTMDPDASKPAYDEIQFGAGLYSSHNYIMIPFDEWIQLHLGYQMSDNFYITGTLGFGLNSFYFYHEGEGGKRTNVITVVFAPGLRYQAPLSDTLTMPLGLSLGYKGGFYAVKGSDHEPSYHAMKVKLYGGLQFLITDYFSFGPGITFDLEYGVYKEYDGELSKEEDILSIKTGADLSISFYF